MKKHLTIKREHNVRYQELKDIPGYEGRYAATKNGQIYSYIQHKFLLQETVETGYKRVCLIDANGIRKHMRVHRAVLSAFCPVEGMENLDANHLNENRTDNRLENLCWMSHRDNLNYGDHNKRVSKAVSKKVYCQELDRVFNSQKEAAQVLNIHASGISQCCRGRIETTRGYHFCYWKGEE